ncbi:MAG TPA: nitrogenase component 1 [Methylomusa anaerophila]|uniref:Nitrogenase molybdenum-iron protein alpha chain n=1 Tax=Methylomusa anaerophila TaxID=1930071 RepID=A0A348AEN6_9FIRM|nr:nitrogenase component 1 [Methylomusa anaerophila]BBB89534.1 nitrogenase molybdenum-iron protein alpha chain [Methylomusa anaerophila]HML90096.1 nitrogenase component 1 [Methylomusa anaerophila]
MAIHNLENEVAIREQRLGAITGYKGTINDLVSKASTCAQKNSSRCFTQASSCNSGCAQNYLCEIVDAVIVNHAPVGCAADQIGSNTLNKWSEKARGWDGWQPRNIGFFNTNMTKEDTVFGATEKLKATVREAYRRHNPNAIFVTTSCVSGIIGEDIKSALDELKEEIPIPLAPVYCEGFKTKVWASGFDAAFHAILTSIVKPPRAKTNKVNIFNFHARARVEIAEIFARLGLEPVFMVAQCTVEQLSRMSEAAASMAICGTLSTYIENALEELYGVPSVKGLHPQGIAGIQGWLRGLGKVVGKEDEVEVFLAEQQKKYQPALTDLRKKLKGRRAVIGMGPGFAHDYVRVLTQELGMEVVWATSWHFDQKFDNGNAPDSARHLSEDGSDVPISVCDLQAFEMMNILNKFRPDIYLSRHGGTAGWAAKMGVASIMITDEYDVFGYRGTVNFGYKMLDALTNRSRERNIAKWMKLPYTDWWLKQNSFQFLAQEAE